MQRYAETKECREVFLRNYFGETGARPCGRCDNCRKKPEEIPEIQKKDLQQILAILKQQGQQQEEQIRQQTSCWPCCFRIDRKSTRLNSSHVAISYAVFCLKKKKK